MVACLVDVPRRGGGMRVLVVQERDGADPVVLEGLEEQLGGLFAFEVERRAEIVEQLAIARAQRDDARRIGR